ncbi:MAG: PucR family transcriptional regulator, partial [Promicromonosporaceae bacterium]|nr:PucR family transcriptional regulator [Promicromonosporaceae bacterium]
MNFSDDCRTATIARVREGIGYLTTAALRQLDEELDWYRALPAQERSYIGLVAHEGIASFV